MQRMAGVASTSTPRWRSSYRSRGLNQCRSREEAPLAEVLRLMVREAMTGTKPPPAARAVVDLWRPDLDQSQVLRDLDELAKRLADDQDAFAKPCTAC